jgi:hypothetical protein
MTRIGGILIYIGKNPASGPHSSKSLGISYGQPLPQTPQKRIIRLEKGINFM